MKSRINRDEREISISELWWYVISKWKWLVVGMVVGALLMGAFGAYRAYANKKADNAETTNIAENLTKEEREEVEKLIEDYEFYLLEVERLENNYLMNLDYNLVDRCTITYYVDTDYSYNYMDIQENYATELVAAYKAYANSEEIKREIINLGIDGLEELDLNYIITSSNEGNIVKFSIVAGEGECITIATLIDEKINKYYDCLSEKIGEHKLVAIGKDIANVYSENIKNRQSVQDAYLKSIADEINLNKKSLSISQIKVFEGVIAENDVIETTNKNVKAIEIKNYIIGLFGGLALAVLVIVVVFIAGKKIYSTSDIEQMYGIEIIGKVLLDKTVNKSVIRKINNIITKEAEVSQKEYVAEIIIRKCELDGINKVVFCSSTKNAINEIPEIIQIVQSAGITIKCIKDIVCDKNSIKTVINNNIIFVEQINVTKKMDFIAEVDIADKILVNTIGVIVIL